MPSTWEQCPLRRDSKKIPNISFFVFNITFKSTSLLFTQGLIINKLTQAWDWKKQSDLYQGGQVRSLFISFFYYTNQAELLGGCPSISGVGDICSLVILRNILVTISPVVNDFTWFLPSRAPPIFMETQALLLNIESPISILDYRKYLLKHHSK